MQRCDKEYIHGQLAVESARIQGILPEGDTIWEAVEDDKVSIATGDATVTLHNWRLEMEQLSISTNDAEVDDNEKQLTREGRVLALSDLWEIRHDRGKGIPLCFGVKGMRGVTISFSFSFSYHMICLP